MSLHSVSFPFKSVTSFIAIISVFAYPENLRLSIKAAVSTKLSPSSSILIVTVICSPGETGWVTPPIGIRLEAPASAPGFRGVLSTKSNSAGIPL